MTHAQDSLFDKNVYVYMYIRINDVYKRSILNFRNFKARACWRGHLLEGALIGARGRLIEWRDGDDAHFVHKSQKHKQSYLD